MPPERAGDDGPEPGTRPAELGELEPEPFVVGVDDDDNVELGASLRGEIFRSISEFLSRRRDACEPESRSFGTPLIASTRIFLILVSPKPKNPLRGVRQG